MNIIEFLNKQIEARSKDLEEVRAKIKASESADEVRALGEEAEKINKSIAEARDQLAAEEAKAAEAEKADKGEGDDKKDEEKGAESRSFNPMASYGQKKAPEARGNDKEDERSSMEYRSAFMKYVQRGEVSEVLKMNKRADAVGVSSDLGILLPMTIIQEIMTDVEKIYGQLYSRVKKTNIKGGVKYPIGSFEASFTRITETGEVSDRQNPGKVTGYVEFSYNIGEIRVARTLLQSILTVPAFEKEFAKVVVEAYVKAMDHEIMTGDPDKNQMTGILTELEKTNSRIKADHIIEFSDEDMKDWKTWQEKLFAVIPLSMRSLRPEFVMTAHTYEANIKTLVDDNNRPVYNETYNPVDGAEISRFKGREVVFVEEDIVKNFNDAKVGEVFGMYWVPEKAYAINTNMEFTSIKYTDHEKNQFVEKALVVNDGKVLDPKYLYILKKKASTTASETPVA